MAERFVNIYITAREFINNWEKEVYELTQLDYFIFLLINEIGSSLEHGFMAERSGEDVMRLDKQEIASLAFAVGDSLNTFLDNNCFGACSLGCPAKLAKPFTQKEETAWAGITLKEFEGKPKQCSSHEECLFHDVMNFVIVDVLIDFYNYELVVDVDETDPDINKLALFIMESILGFTHKNGALLLKSPQDSAMDDFNEILLDDTGTWDDEVMDDAISDDEDEDDESWKYGNLAISSFIETFQEDRPAEFMSELTPKLLRAFEQYLDNYLGTSYVDGFEFDDLIGFFVLDIPQAFVLDDTFSWDSTKKIFLQFFKYIDEESDSQFTDKFKVFCELDLPEIRRTFSATQMVHKKMSLLEFMLNPQDNSFKPAEGYYEVVDVSTKGFTFYDIHLKSFYRGISLGEASSVGIKPGDIIHGHIAVEKDQGALRYVELIYPPACKYLLY